MRWMDAELGLKLEEELGHSGHHGRGCIRPYSRNLAHSPDKVSMAHLTPASPSVLDRDAQFWLLLWGRQIHISYLAE